MSPGVLFAEIGGLAIARLLHGSLLPSGSGTLSWITGQLVETQRMVHTPLRRHYDCRLVLRCAADGRIAAELQLAR